MKPTEAQLAHLILAFHEGTLSAVEKTQLNALVLKNPEFAFDLEANPILISTSIQIDSTLFSHPLLEDLEIYKNEEGHPFEKLAIGSLENQLSAQEQAIEQAYFQNPSYQKVKKQLTYTQLQPDGQITFLNQQSLLKAAPIRSFNWKFYAMVGSSAAAVLLAVTMIGQSNSDGNNGQTKPRQQARLVRGKNTLNKKEKPILTPVQAASQERRVVIVPCVDGEIPRDCIMPLQVEPVFSEVYAQNGIENDPNHESNTPNPTFEGNWSNAETKVQNSSSAFAKEPITVKAFLLQKTNEKLFGTAAPSIDLKLETFARYASQTVGIPVQYRVEEMTDSDKVVFQLGRFTMERNRVKK